MKTRSFAKITLLILFGEFFISAILLRILRNFGNLQLFEQIVISCVSGALILGLGILLFFEKIFPNFHDRFNILLILIASMLIMLIVAPNTVMNIDRSRSFYVLGWVENEGVRIDKEGALVLLVKSNERFSAVSIRERIDEQSARGLIMRQEDRYQLTRRGVIAVRISDFVAKFYGLEGWFNNRN